MGMSIPFIGSNSNLGFEYDEEGRSVENSVSARYTDLIEEKNDDGTLKYPFLNVYTNLVKRPERQIVGREKEMERLMAAMMRPELCNVILLAEAGTGKALANDTLIPVADERGYVPIGEISVGDVIYDEYGCKTNVLGVYPQGKKRAYRVVLNDGTSVVCNDEHIWAARKYYAHNRDENPNNFYEEVTLREMMDYGIKHSVSRKDKSYIASSWYIPVSKPLIRDEREHRIHPYVMGVLLGDGCLTESVLAVSSKDEEIIAKVADLLGATDYCKNKYNYTWHFIDGNHLWQTSFRNTKWLRTDALAACGDYDSVFGALAYEKRIPRDYFLGSIEQRFALLQGLMDTDGCIRGGKRGNCSYSTTSEGLADDIRELAASLGIRTCLTSMQREDKSRTEYSVHFSIEYWRKQDLFSLSRKKDKAVEHAESYDFKFRKIYDDIAVSDVVDLGYDVDMTCIYVDSPNHLFIAGKEHIVTHNTALVQGTMMKDTSRLYLEVDLSKMIADLQDPNQMADRLKQLFNETQIFREDNDVEIVLFMDEFHQIIQLSSAAVEALKPLLADSGTRGIRVIAATTYIEFRKYVQPNQPLVERLQRINLDEPDRKMTVQILKGMARRYGVENQFYNDHIFEQIYDFTNRYIPANSQPRKSILVLDSMVGWYRFTKRKINLRLLADVIYESEGVNIAFRVDATKIKEELDKYVFAQDFATSVIEERLQVCVADLNDKSKPMSSFLFTGSTGVGKSTTVDTRIPIYTDDGSVYFKRAGDVVPGDFVFDREGRPTKVLDVFPQGKLSVYKVTLEDGRSLEVSGNHLWSVSSDGNDFCVVKTKDLLDEGLIADDGSFRHVIPMNQAVLWPEREYSVDPYVVGSLVVDRETAKYGDEILAKLSDVVGLPASLVAEYDWYFLIHRLLKNEPNTDLCYRKYPMERRIPLSFMVGSVEQRYRLLQGLFDRGGRIDETSGLSVVYTTMSELLAYDVQNLIYSLGFSALVKKKEIGLDDLIYEVIVPLQDASQVDFFSVAEQRRRVLELTEGKSAKPFIGIRSIEKQDEMADMICFYVDNEEHLYQAGPYVVTHNTEVTKQLARILFQDTHRLIRFDMTEYANEDSLDTFRHELTNRVWERPYSIILLDEIEKACAPVTRILLQVLDDGRLMDENNREVTFTNAYIIMTTNAGSEIYEDIAQYHSSDTGSGDELPKYMKLIRESISSTTGDNKFPPELLGRIDCIVPFQPLSLATQMKIIQEKLRQLAVSVREKHGVELQVTKDVIDYICRDNLDTEASSGGARAAISKMNEEVVTKVARHINKYPEDNVLRVDVEGAMAWKNKAMLESDARIVIKRVRLNGV